MATDNREDSRDGFGFALEDVRRLIGLVESRKLARLEIEEENRRLLIVGARGDSGGEARPPALSTAEAVAEANRAAARANRITIESPMVGVFYRAASPDAPPLVEVGDRIETGQAVGIIEAMKVFSEIPSDHAGVVVEIPAKNGALVRQGEPLIYLRAD